MSTYQAIIEEIGNLATNRKVGIEMEGNRSYDKGTSWFEDNLPSGWDAYVDGSLDSSYGMEVNTPPMMNLMEVYNGWNVMQQANFNFTESAGTHVHVDVTDFTVLDLVKLYYFTASVETILFSLVYNYRYHRSWWCQQFRGKGWEKAIDHLDLVESYLGRSWYGGSNFRNFAGARERWAYGSGELSDYELPFGDHWLRIRSKTVEWRLFNCVGDDTTGDMAIAFALLAHHTVETVKNSTVEQLKFMVNEIMSATDGEDAIARLCSALNLPAYPKQGEDSFNALERFLVQRNQARQAQAV